MFGSSNFTGHSARRISLGSWERGFLWRGRRERRNLVVFANRVNRFSIALHGKGRAVEGSRWSKIIVAGLPENAKILLPFRASGIRQCSTGPSPMRRLQLE